MQPINYDDAIFTISCHRKHLLVDSKYYVYVLPSVLILASNPKQQNPKYVIPLTLTTKIHWITKFKSTEIEQFGFQYKEGVKFFLAPSKDLYQLKKTLQGKIMFKDISDFYSPICMLGKGGSSKVYLVTKKGDDEQFASKCVDKRYLIEDGGFNALFNEIQLMQNLKDNHFIQLIDLYEGEHTFYIILEYLQGKSLHEMLNQRTCILEQEQIKIIMKVKNYLIQQLLLEAVDYMHSKGVMHRDLKPENIMFKFPNQLDSLKIVDFGLATSRDVDQFPFPKCGTPGYVAPEIANLKDLTAKYDLICDEFSVGCIFYKLCTGKELFPGTDYKEILKLNKKCNVVLETLAIYKTPIEAIDLITQLLKVNPLERLSAKEALKHEYFSKKYESKKGRFQYSNVGKQNPLFQTQNFNVTTFVSKFDDDAVEDEHTTQLTVPVMQNVKSFGLIHKMAISPNQPRKNFKKFQTSEFDQYLPAVSPQFNNFKPSLILNSESYQNSPNPDKGSTKSSINYNVKTDGINFMYKIDEEQEENGLQK